MYGAYKFKININWSRSFYAHIHILVIMINCINLSKYIKWTLVELITHLIISYVILTFKK